MNALVDVRPHLMNTAYSTLPATTRRYVMKGILMTAENGHKTYAHRLDFSSPDWAYLLGVFHGDGTVGPRSVTIAVGYQDAAYSRVLTRVLKSLQLTPKIYRCRTALSVQAHSKHLAD